MANKPTGNQYMPFAALKGYEEKLREKEIVKEERKILSEEQENEINDVFLTLEKGMKVEICFYYKTNYLTKVGTFQRIDMIERKIMIANFKISFKDIYYIKRVFD